MPAPAADGQRRVYLLVTSPDAPGGIARSVARLANHLADSSTVEVIGLRRLGSRRHYPLDERITVRYVVDEVSRAQRLLDRLPSVKAGFNRRQAQSALTDRLLPKVLRTLEPGIVISTRPLLHLAAVDDVPPHCILVGQDHVNLQFRHANESIKPVARAIDGLDQFVVLTEADAESYRELFPQATDRIRVIRNAAPWPVLDHDVARSRVIVAAGALNKRKGFDRLIDAFVPIAEQKPNWRVHIYGEGRSRGELAERIADRGMRGRVVLKGRTDDMAKVLEDASIFALSSRNEGLPMVLIEAMTKGVPVVSFDCPRGPAELVDDGVTGTLVPNGDVPGFTAALLAQMDDPALRRGMGQAALERAGQYQLPRVMQEWTDLFDQLRSAGPRATRPAGRGRGR